MSFMGLFKRKSSGAEASAPASSKSVNAALQEPAGGDLTSSMSELVVRALIPITRENWPYVQRLTKRKIWLAEDEDFNTILGKFDSKASGAYVRCDDPARPFIAVNGDKKSRVQLWTRRDMPVDADHMVMIQSNVFEANGKVITFMPQLVVRGKDAPFIMIYRMSCCGKSSYSILTSIGDKSDKNFSAVLDSNPKEIKPGMGSGVFYNPTTNSYKVRAATPQDAVVMETLHKLIGERRNDLSSSPAPEQIRQP